MSLIEPTEDDEEEGGFELGDGADAGDDAVEEDPDHHRVEEEEVASSPHRKSKSSRTSDVLNVAPSPKLNGKVKAKAKASAKEKKGPAPRKHPRDESGEDDGGLSSRWASSFFLLFWLNLTIPIRYCSSSLFSSTFRASRILAKRARYLQTSTVWDGHQCCRSYPQAAC